MQPQKCIKRHPCPNLSDEASLLPLLSGLSEEMMFSSGDCPHSPDVAMDDEPAVDGATAVDEPP